MCIKCSEHCLTHNLCMSCSYCYPHFPLEKPLFPSSLSLCDSERAASLLPRLGLPSGTQALPERGICWPNLPGKKTWPGSGSRVTVDLPLVNCHCLVNQSSFYFILFFNVYLFLRERESTSRGEAGAERIRCRLCADSRDAGLELTNPEVMTWAKVRCLMDWATQGPAPQSSFYNLSDPLYKRKYSHNK